MTVTLHLKPELEADLLAGAKARGMTLEDFLRQLVEEAVSAHTRGANHPAPSGRENAVRAMLEFADKYRLSLGEPVSRKLLHEGHRF